MKDTSGEFSMTVIVIIGAIIIVGLLTAIGPKMGEYIGQKWNDLTGSGNAASDNAKDALNNTFNNGGE